MKRRRLRRHGRARPLPARPRAPHHRRPPRESGRSTRATPSATSSSAATHMVFAPNYGSPFVTRPRPRPPLRHDRGLPEFREARPTPRPTCTIPAARSASPSTCPSTSATSTWSIRTSAGDKPFMGSVTHPEPRARTASTWPGSLFGARIPRERTRSCTSLINANSPLVWDAAMLGAARGLRAGEPGRAHHAIHAVGRDEPGHNRRRRAPRCWPR